MNLWDSPLVESRKLMDRQPALPHPTFRMFANWAVHIGLSVPSKPLTALLEAFEAEYIDEKLNGRKWRRTEYENFSIFRRSTREFLHSVGLPTGTVDDDEAWLLFALKYALVVSDCPVTLKAKRMAHLDKVEPGRAGLVLWLNRQELAGLNWEITPHQGKPFIRSIAIEKVTNVVPPPPSP